MSPPSIALVHDYLLVNRGAERTFSAIAECWPEAPIYTLLYDEEGTEGRFTGSQGPHLIPAEAASKARRVPTPPARLPAGGTFPGG